MPNVIRMNTPVENMDTKQKALTINLDDSIYGTIAEIGAGQEVAGNFFRAGAASGTLAKTISAYDMTFSDEIYGKEASGRYVCEARIHKMLKKEYSLVEERLKSQRAGTSKFFAFADTISARNFHGTNECHGWLGLKFQHEAGAAPSEIVLHVRMLDSQNIQQCQAVGMIGVNMIYASFYYLDRPEQFVLSIMDNLNSQRIEVDMIRVDGEAFKQFDNRLLSLMLVKHGMTDAVMFDTDGSVVQPSEILYKKNIFALRGSFRPPTHVNMNMLEAGYDQFLREPDVDAKKSVLLTEITLTNLESDGELCENDFLSRVDLLATLGHRVLISNYHEYYRLSKYFSRFTQEMVVMALGIDNLMELFNPTYYDDLPGGILEAFGLLFNQHLRLYVYPMQRDEKAPVTTSQNIMLPQNLVHLYKYVKDNGYIADYDNYDSEKLHIFSRKALTMLQTGEPGWEEMVPPPVVTAIKKKSLFGYQSLTEVAQVDTKQSERSSKH